MSRKLLITALFVAQAAWAGPQEEMLYYRDGVRIDPAEVSRILAGPVRTRSIRLLPEGQRDASVPTVSLSTTAHAAAREAAAGVPGLQVAAAAVELAPERPQPESIALPVQFAFDSSEILPRAREQLDAVAEGIKMLPESHRVLIEGHTDALGAQDYNLQLSRKRAEAVKRYLVDEHGLDPRRLRTVGFGKERPISGADATNPENRRVQFRGA